MLFWEEDKICVICKVVLGNILDICNILTSEAVCTLFGKLCEVIMDSMSFERCWSFAHFIGEHILNRCITRVEFLPISDASLERQSNSSVNETTG